MTPYNLHDINTRNQADRLRERDEIRLAARVRAQDEQAESAPTRAGGFRVLHPLQVAFTALRQAVRP